jgi:hypothetical protein
LKLEWVLTSANATRTNRSTEEIKIINFGHPPYDRPLRTLLSFRDRTPSALTAGPSSSPRSRVMCMYVIMLFSRDTSTELARSVVFAASLVWLLEELRSVPYSLAPETVSTRVAHGNSYFKTYLITYRPMTIHTYHSRFIPEGVAEVSQIYLRDTHILPKLISYEEHCRRDRW